MSEIEPLPRRHSDEKAKNGHPDDLMTLGQLTSPQDKSKGASGIESRGDMTARETVADGERRQDTRSRTLEPSFQEFTKETTSQHDQQKMSRFSPTSEVEKHDQRQSPEDEEERQRVIFRRETLCSRTHKIDVLQSIGRRRHQEARAQRETGARRRSAEKTAGRGVEKDYSSKALMASARAHSIL